MVILKIPSISSPFPSTFIYLFISHLFEKAQAGSPESPANMGLQDGGLMIWAKGRHPTDCTTQELPSSTFKHNLTNLINLELFYILGA